MLKGQTDGGSDQYQKHPEIFRRNPDSEKTFQAEKVSRLDRLVRDHGSKCRATRELKMITIRIRKGSTIRALPPENSSTAEAKSEGIMQREKPIENRTVAASKRGQGLPLQ